ncbi:redox-regulated ATPase YchF [Candidatus Woesearchaeota archaeon]|nr:redox-regulated ATPase YchF [Candidatus Woesearchaeota archaeon]
MLIGIVGKPSCGKSTFFKAATLSEVEIANYPFTTIKPNHAIGFVKVKDPAIEFGKKSNPRMGYVLDGWRFVPVDLIDVAGLVPGAHKGEGMGSQFLNDLNQADALIHVIDISGSINERGEPCQPGGYDPLNDVRFLEKELDYWYKDLLSKSWVKFSRQVQQEKREIHIAIAKQLSGVGVSEEMSQNLVIKLGLNEIPALSWTDDQLLSLAKEFRIRTKPMLIAANKIDVPGAKENLERLKKEFPDYIVIPCSSESELALKEAAKHGMMKYVPGENSFELTGDLNEKQKAALEFIKSHVLDDLGTTGVQDVLNTAVFELLKYKPIYPGGVAKLEDSEGNVIPDCFLMPEKATALDFAFKLHTDFGKNFIKAINVKTKLPVGKDHILNAGDIIEIAARK